jgi:hypothetical protein
MTTEADPRCRRYLRPTGASATARPGALRYGANEVAEIWYDQELGTRGRQLAEAVLARTADDVAAISTIFQGVRPPGPLRVFLQRTPDSARAFHDDCAGTSDSDAGTAAADAIDVHCDVETTPVLQPLYSSFLLASQVTEIIASRHGRGWRADAPHGEALSRTIAASLYPRRLAGFATAATWLRSDRRDFVNGTHRGDSDAVAIGCCALFLHYLHTELDFSWAQIVAAGGHDLATTYRRLTGNVDDPFPAFARQLAVSMPPGLPFSVTGDNPFPLTAATTSPPPPAAVSVRAEPVPVPAGAGPALLDAPPEMEPPRARPDLASAIAHRRWWTCDTPFRHLRVDDVFQPQVYAGLERDFLARVERDELKRTLPGYDASALGLTGQSAGPFEIFLNRQWHDLIAGLFGFDGTGDMTATLHHHAAGSRSGSPHNDLNPGWFAAQPPVGPDEIRVHDPATSNYRTGTSPSGQTTVERVRGITVLYYLATPAGVRGGGTGLYRSAAQAIGRPDVVVPPRNNSLVAFECTPYSFHSFLANYDQPRNCVAMWLHRDIAEVLQRWGRSSMVAWK